MPTYILLGNFSDQGIRDIKKTTDRAKSMREMAKKMKVTIKEVYWTIGHHDVVTIAEAPDDETMTALLLSAGAAGNLRTQTLRAFSADEMDRILGKLG